MNAKKVAAVCAVAILVGGELASEHSDSLMPPQHTHSEFRADPVATVLSPISASGRQGAFDPLAFDGAFDIG